MTPSAGDKWRLFVAVAIPEAVRDELAESLDPLRQAWPDARWVDPSRWHLTLQFLGWLPLERVDDVRAAVAAAAAGVDGPFALALSGTAGQFGGRVAWVGIATSDPLARLAARVGAELAGIGFPPEDRPFRAHLTVARARGRGRLPPGLVREALPAWAGPTAAWTVSEVAVLRSQPGRGGAVYTPVAPPSHLGGCAP